jgi:DoxX-like family
MKQSRISLITGIVLTVLLSLVLVASAVFKLTLDPNSGQGLELAQNVGIGLLKPLALIDFVLLVLLWIPRTSALGFVLTFGYWSGAMATHLTHESPITIQPMLMILTLAASFFRTPELLSRLLQSNRPSY